MPTKPMAFLRRVQARRAKRLQSLEAGRFAVLVIGDEYGAGELGPLGFECMSGYERSRFQDKVDNREEHRGQRNGKGRTITCGATDAGRWASTYSSTNM